MTKPKSESALELLGELARLGNENHRLRAVLEELSEYSPDCDHDIIARRALHPAPPRQHDHSICPFGECLYP